MADIVQILPVRAKIADVFRAVSTPDGLQSWWTKRAWGEPGSGAEYELWFGPKHDWRAVVTRYLPETLKEKAARSLRTSQTFPDVRGVMLLLGLVSEVTHKVYNVSKG